MSIKSTNDTDAFTNVIETGLRMYGNGYSYPKEVVNYVMENCRQQIRNYFFQHRRLTLNTKNQSLHLNTLVFCSRYKRSRLKRLQQFLQAKERSTMKQDVPVEHILKDKKLTVYDRFNRICHRLEIPIEDYENQSSVLTLDHERARQYARLDAYYNNDTLTTDDYLLFVEQQHSSFNNLRSLSSFDIGNWLNLNEISSSNQDLRLTEICIFLIKEILLNLMDEVYQSKLPSQPRDIFRRQYVNNNRRLPYSGRKRTNLLIIEK